MTQPSGPEMHPYQPEEQAGDPPVPAPRVSPEGQTPATDWPDVPPAPMPQQPEAPGTASEFAQQHSGDSGLPYVAGPPPRRPDAIDDGAADIPEMHIEEPDVARVRPYVAQMPESDTVDEEPAAEAESSDTEPNTESIAATDAAAYPAAVGTAPIPSPEELQDMDAADDAAAGVGPREDEQAELAAEQEESPVAEPEGSPVLSAAPEMAAAGVAAGTAAAVAESRNLRREIRAAEGSRWQRLRPSNILRAIDVHVRTSTPAERLNRIKEWNSRHRAERAAFDVGTLTILAVGLAYGALRVFGAVRGYTAQHSPDAAVLHHVPGTSQSATPGVTPEVGPSGGTTTPTPGETTPPTGGTEGGTGTGTGVGTGSGDGSSVVDLGSYNSQTGAGTLWSIGGDYNLQIDGTPMDGHTQNLVIHQLAAYNGISYSEASHLPGNFQVKLPPPNVFRAWVAAARASQGL